MARIFIYDSSALLTSEGLPLEPMSLIYGVYRKSIPVRMSGLPKPLLYVSYEWQIDANVPGVWNFLWYQEFWGDSAGWDGPRPSNRTAPGLLPTGPWPRETIEVISDPTNVINQAAITRSITATPAVDSPDSRWVTLGNWAEYVRIAVTLNTDPAVAQQPAPRLRIWAHVGGYPTKYFEGLSAPYGGEIGP